jgi:hypothetical protein
MIGMGAYIDGWPMTGADDARPIEGYHGWGRCHITNEGYHNTFYFWSEHFQWEFRSSCPNGGTVTYGGSPGVVWCVKERLNK